MSSPYRKFSTKKTSQSQPIPGSDQVKNNAGGYTFGINKWGKLDRFLILGTESPTYYVGEQKLTRENANSVISCIKEDGKRVVDRIIEISVQGRAPKNDPALFALAMCSALGGNETRKAAFEVLSQVARIGTHLFHFVAFREQFGGWGRGMRNAIANWYLEKSIYQLAYQVIKYQQRDGWSHRDLLRLSHPKTADKDINAVYKYIVDGGYPKDFSIEIAEKYPDLVIGAEEIKHYLSLDGAIGMIGKYNLPRETIPTQLLKESGVWRVLLQKMPMTAMIRNLATMTKVGLLKPFAEENNLVIERLHDEERIKKARIHPIQILSALKTYAQGHGARSGASWNPISQIVDALDDAFYLSFKAVEPTRKNILIGLDISGSMDSGSVANVPGLTPRVASAALCLVTTNVESNYYIMGFTGDVATWNQYQTLQNRQEENLKGFIPLNISPKMRLDSVVREISGLRLGPTDCALPMIYALKNKLSVDAFIVYTDNETWCGKIHPVQALQEYRRKMNIPAKLIVVGMTANGFSIADPNDAGMLDVVGFDSATPQLISEFIKG